MDRPFGDIFINLLKLIAIPLVLFSIISGVSGLSDITKLGRTGLGMMALYLTTTFIAVSIGLLVVNVIKPGELADDTQRLRNRITYELWVNDTPSVEKPKDGRCLSCDPANKAIVDEVAAAQAETRHGCEGQQALWIKRRHEAPVRCSSWWTWCRATSS